MWVRNIEAEGGLNWRFFFVMEDVSETMLGLEKNRMLDEV